ncbi:MAG: ABC transporter permease [Microbacteriaceae bacterium]|jgi:D-methionine transport system permease protein|nr:ABC transporter permease [Microbacteriaceae bacterium]MCI1206837.1 ABC transporter permease [Microbacteriaceae bacterium]
MNWWNDFSSTVAPQLLQATVETLWMVTLTLLIAGVAGLLFGVLLSTTRPGGILQNRVVFTLLNLLVNTIRPVPFIILVFAIGPLTRLVVGTTIGDVAGVFVMCVSATFGISRIVEQNLVSTDPGVLEAAKAMGASPVRIILTVLLPEALAPLILGYTFVFIAIVDMSAMVGAVGAGGLGNYALVYGYQRFDWGVTYATVIVIIVLVQLVQYLGNTLAKRALRH